jgi:hypothetical protein
MEIRFRKWLVRIDLEWAWSFYVIEGPGLHMSACGPLHISISET